MRKSQHSLSLADKAALMQVAVGADVYSYGLACTLRAIQLEHPELIEIGPAEMPPENGAQRQPYFGAILTAAGQRALARSEQP